MKTWLPFLGDRAGRIILLAIKMLVLMWIMLLVLRGCATMGVIY